MWQQSAWARGSHYWPPGKKGHKAEKDGKDKKGKGKGRHELSSAAQDYQERRRGARMQMSRSETILIRHRPTRTMDGAPQVCKEKSRTDQGKGAHVRSGVACSEVGPSAFVLTPVYFPHPS